MALDDYSGFGSYVYDRETDRMEMLFDSMDPDVMEIQEAMEEDESGRFVTVYADSNLGYDAMVAFIQELPEDEVRSRLERAIHGKGAFRYFRDTVRMQGSSRSGTVSATGSSRMRRASGVRTTTFRSPETAPIISIN